MHRVRMTSESREDVRAASRWYESQRKGLGHEFIAKLREAFEAVSSRPLSFPKAHREMRCAQLHRFPYGVFFVADQSSQATVLAVMDLRRNPRSWKKRA